jgi:hypothetical protein
MTTFMCEKNQYPLHDLLEFSRRANVRVIIRNYARITPGGIIFTGVDDEKI